MKAYTKNELMRMRKQPVEVPVWIIVLQIMIIVGFGILLIIASN